MGGTKWDAYTLTPLSLDWGGMVHAPSEEKNRMKLRMPEVRLDLKDKALLILEDRNQRFRSIGGSCNIS